MPKGVGYGEGMQKTPVTMGNKRQNNKQPSGGGGYSNGAFGKGAGSASAGGVTFEGAAAKTTRNNGNYNEVGGKARQFGTGGAMKG